jgi:hypothetical protein
MPQPLSVVLVEKTGQLKALNIKDYDVNELYKKCGFKKADGFVKQVDWPIKLNGNKYLISMYAKTDGKANTENKYDFPPPIDTKLYFGMCVLVCSINDGKNNYSLCNLTTEMWEKMYEKLFDGFEDLAVTNAEDEDEEDELLNIPKSKKTKIGGYLKDGFVVEDDDNEEVSDSSDKDSDNYDDSDSTIEIDGKDEQDGSDNIEDVGSELSEESYETDNESDIDTEDDINDSKSD